MEKMQKKMGSLLDVAPCQTYAPRPWSSGGDRGLTVHRTIGRSCWQRERRSPQLYRLAPRRRPAIRREVQRQAMTPSLFLRELAIRRRKA